MLYCFVNEDTINQPSALPINYGNISNFYLLEYDIVNSYGFYIFEAVDEPPYNPYGQRLTKELVLTNGVVQYSYSVVDLTAEEIGQMLIDMQVNFAQIIENYLDQVVQQRGYKNTLSACTYVNSSITKNQNESLAVIAWRDEVWAKAEEIQSDILQGLRTIPTLEEFIAELPVLEWPS